MKLNSSAQRASATQLNSTRTELSATHEALRCVRLRASCVGEFHEYANSHGAQQRRVVSLN